MRNVSGDGGNTVLPWLLIRQDGHGNRYRVGSYATRDEAQRIADRLGGGGGGTSGTARGGGADGGSNGGESARGDGTGARDGTAGRNGGSGPAAGSGPVRPGGDSYLVECLEPGSGARG